MTRSGGSARRSGDPRKRTAQPAAREVNLRVQLVAALVAGVALVAIALFALRSNDTELDEDARTHASAACDLTSDADEAVQVDSPVRYAAAALLLDQAIVESGRAAEADPAVAALDRAVQAVHQAAHQGDRDTWRDALDDALAACRKTFG